jgi:hypothetical protein
MGTRCVLIVENLDEYLASSVSYDGYPSYMFEEVLPNFNTHKLAYQLVEMGDASSLDTTLGKCTFYHRDRNEAPEDVMPRVYASRGEAMDAEEGEYTYFFGVTANKWKIISL